MSDKTSTYDPAKASCNHREAVLFDESGFCWCPDCGGLRTVEWGSEKDRKWLWPKWVKPSRDGNIEELFLMWEQLQRSG